MNFCGTCSEDFSSLGETFDRHRVGVHEYVWSLDRPKGRRCLTREELIELGLELNPSGRWHDPARFARTVVAFEKLRAA